MVAVAKQLDVDNTLLPSPAFTVWKTWIGVGRQGKIIVAVALSIALIIRVIERSWITDSLYLQQYSSYVCGYT
jgi:hypothetical protein